MISRRLVWSSRRLRLRVLDGCNSPVSDNARVIHLHDNRLRTEPVFQGNCSNTTRTFHSTGRVSDDTATSLVEETPKEEPPHPTEIQYSFTPPPPLSPASMVKVEELFKKIIWLDMIEVHLLTQLVHENMGGKWTDLQASGGPVNVVAVAADASDSAQPQSTLKDVKLMGFDAKAKIKVIKEVRAISGLGLKEAKELVESAPKFLQKGLKPEQAEELKTRLEAVGAIVEIA